MEAKKIPALIFTIIGIALTFIILFIDHKNGRQMGMESDNNYYIEISGRVSAISQNRGTIKLRLKSNSHKVYYMGVTRNFEYEPSFLDDFLKSGDSIYKAPNSLELFVFKNGRKYRFVIDETINKPKQ